jgi:uncharacterized protein (DUF952 family)
MIYHITTKAEWQAAEQKGFYEAPSLHTEGFIHTSEEAQLQGVLDRYYQGKKDLILLHINEERLTSPLKYELAKSVGEEFPHIYGAINLDAVDKVKELN